MSDVCMALNALWQPESVEDSGKSEVMCLVPGLRALEEINPDKPRKRRLRRRFLVVESEKDDSLKQSLHELSLKEKESFSKPLSDFLDFCERVRELYIKDTRELKNMDLLTQDYLHLCELNKLSSQQASRLTHNLADCRRCRRNYKDILEELEPLVNILQSAEWGCMKYKLDRALLDIQKAEESHTGRHYDPRILSTIGPQKLEYDRIEESE